MKDSEWKARWTSLVSQPSGRCNAVSLKTSTSHLVRPLAEEGCLVLDFGHVAASGGSSANAGVLPSAIGIICIKCQWCLCGLDGLVWTKLPTASHLRSICNYVVHKSWVWSCHLSGINQTPWEQWESSRFQRYEAIQACERGDGKDLRSLRS